LFRRTPAKPPWRPSSAGSMIYYTRRTRH
jgi:hypothetical protein